MEHQGDIVVREIRIVNRQGLHARPVMKFVEIAGRFRCQVRVDKGEGTEQVDGKSPMDMLLLDAPLGVMLRITAIGDDAAPALDAIEALVTGGFGEE